MLTYTDEFGHISKTTIESLGMLGNAPKRLAEQLATNDTVLVDHGFCYAANWPRPAEESLQRNRRAPGKRKSMVFTPNAENGEQADGYYWMIVGKD